jgi:hypothetical protein
LATRSGSDTNSDCIEDGIHLSRLTSLKLAYRSLDFAVFVVEVVRAVSQLFSGREGGQYSLAQRTCRNRSARYYPYIGTDGFVSLDARWLRDPARIPTPTASKTAYYSAGGKAANTVSRNVLVETDERDPGAFAVKDDANPYIGTDGFVSLDARWLRDPARIPTPTASKTAYMHGTSTPSSTREGGSLATSQCPARRRRPFLA